MGGKDLSSCDWTDHDAVNKRFFPPLKGRGWNWIDQSILEYFCFSFVKATIATYWRSLAREDQLNWKARISAGKAVERQEERKRQAAERWAKTPSHPKAAPKMHHKGGKAQSTNGRRCRVRVQTPANTPSEREEVTLMEEEAEVSNLFPSFVYQLSFSF